VKHWKETGDPYDFLPILGGTNEFMIGSDTLGDERLVEIAESITQAFRSQEV